MAEPINAFEQDFVKLSPEAKRIVLNNNPDFKSMSKEGQDLVIERYTNQFKPPVQQETPKSEIYATKPSETIKSNLIQAYRKVGRPGLEMLGMAGGAMAGTGWMSPVGAGLGAAGTSKALDVLEETIGLKKPSTVKEAITSTGKDLIAGATGEMLGPIANKAITGIAKGAGRIGREILGSTTGAGRGAVEGAIDGGKGFTDAMRGKISGEEVAQNARDALQVVRDKRAFAYQDQLKQIDANQNPIDLQPIYNKTAQLMKNFNVRINPKGEIDISRVKMGEAGKRDIEKIIKRIQDHGTQAGDNTASGLDGLKRELDDFYSDSSQARAFVASLRKEVNDTIVKHVPAYKEMTQKYAEATNLIKDIESGLMLKKTAMSGRVTADNTLRRLTSAMRENFEMRKDLLEALGKESGADISGQVAGYSMNQALPHGLMGKIGGGGLAYLAYLNPKMWPLMAAASPRAVGEFLNVYGKAMRTTKPVRDIAKETAKRFTGPSIYTGLKESQGGQE